MKVQKTKNIFFVIAFILLILFVLNCGDSTPPINIAKFLFLKEAIKTDVTGLYHLFHFEKVNGIRSNQLGYDVYTMYYKATIEFDKNCFYLIHKSLTTQKPFGIEISNRSHPKRPMIGFVEEGRGRPGQKITFEGEINFVKTEKGWDLMR
jgi:hypothetical protein